MGIAEPEEEVGAPAPVGVDERTNRLLGTGVAPAPEPTPESTTGREARLDTKLEAPAEPGTRQRGRSLFDRQMDIVDPSRRYYEGKKDKHKDPSFARDVVWKTATDFAEIPEHMVKGLGTGIRNYAESAEGYAVAEIARLQEQISELADEDYVLPMAEEMYPLEFGMSEKDRQKALEGQRRMTQAYRRTEEAQGGVDAKRERIERIQERLKGIQRFKEVFPEQDFEEVDNFVHQAAHALGQFLPSMAATAGGGLPIGLASYYMQFKGSMYEGMVKQGIPKDRAHDGARIGAALTSLIGVGAMSVSIAALARVFPRAAQGAGVSQANITKTRRALEDIRDFTTPPGMEWVAEFLQQYPEALGQVVAQMPKDATGEEIREEFIRYVQTEEFAKNQIMSANIAGMAGLFMPLGTASVGTAYRRYQMPGKKFDVEGAKDARTRLTDAYQRKEGDMGLLSDHVIAQYNMDLYNRLLRPEGSIFDNMKRKAQMKELREAKELKRAEKILEERGQTLRPEQKTMDEVVSKETKEETADTMTKIWPKREKPDTVQEPEVTPDAAPVVEPEVEAAPVAAEPVTDAAPTTDVMTKKGTPFKSQTAAKSARTRQGMKETHDVVEVEGGYALRPAEQRVEPEAVAETAEVREGNVFEDLEMLLEEHAKIDAGESEMSSADLAPVLENVQNETIRYLEELDPSMRAAFVAGNLELSRNETRQLEDLLNKEATEGLTPEQNSIRNHLIRKMVGKEEITQEYLENKGKEPATEREELIDETPRYFDKSTESVETIRHMFEQKRPEQIKENPETMLGYLTNQINAWIHGVGNADVSRIRQTLQHMRDESSGMYDYFGNQVHLNDFIESVDHAIELANKAESLKTGGSGPILRVTTGLDLFYPAVRDIIAKVQSFRGKMQARDALNKLKKTPGVKAADLEFTGLDRYLNQAARNHQRVTKEELLAAAEKMPEVEITVRATDGTVALPKGYRELVQARDGIRRLAAEGMSSSEFIRTEAERLAPLMETQGVAEFTVDILESYLAGFHELIYVAEQLGDFNTFNRLMEEMPAYTGYSFFRNRYSEYQYEEVLINIPDYSPDPGDMVHSAFGQPVSFFARVARNQDRMIVEEVQSEIATMRSRMKGKPHPFKSDGWPNLIASTLLKRARELGYSEVYIPNFEWVNRRWSDKLPESTRPVYEKVMPEAMERLEAERLSDTIVEDARLGSSSTTPIGEAVARLDTVADYP